MPTSKLIPGFVYSVVTGTACLSGAAQAQTNPAPTSEWTVNVGAAVLSAPRYPGSNDSKATFVPVIDARYKNYLFISPIRGIGVDIPLADGLTGSVAIGLDLASRKEKDDRRLVGLGNVNSAGALLLGLDYRLGDAFAKAGLSSRLGSGNRRGTSVDLDLGYNFVKSPTVVLAAGVNLQTMDNTYARNFFGVSAQQSVASGLKPFNASSGLRSANAFASAFYRFDPQWSMFGRLNLYQLQSDAADSPITQQKGQTTLVVGVLRTF